MFSRDCPQQECSCPRRLHVALSTDGIVPGSTDLIVDHRPRRRAHHQQDVRPRQRQFGRTLGRLLQASRAVSEHIARKLPRVSVLNLSSRLLTSRRLSSWLATAFGIDNNGTNVPLISQVVSIIVYIMLFLFLLSTKLTSNLTESRGLLHIIITL